MARMLVLPWAASLGAVWCSTERKARDGAAILAGGLGLPVAESAELGENDRSATGYLPRTEFETVADLFFANPGESVRGWERAVDAQARVVSAVNHVMDVCAEDSVAIVSHGGVGALLLCHLLRRPIGREHDQPANGGGNYYAFDAGTRLLRHGWTPIDPA